MMFCAGVSAQSSSINTFSPYTFYGLGDFMTQGAAYQQSMGGAGVAYRSAGMINLLNPAALANTGRKSVIFNVGLEGTNVYSSSATTSSSFNTFNIRDIALQMSVYENMGISFSMTPLTEVGYRVSVKETDSDLLVDVGQVEYMYAGEGGVSQFKFGYGLNLFKNVALGAEAVYYHGSIERTFNSVITATIQPSVANGVTGSARDDISKLSYGVGFQASPIFNSKRILTLAATYHKGMNLNPETTRDIQSSGIFVDTVAYSALFTNYIMPDQITAGVSYQTSSFSINADYTYQDWNGENPSDYVNSVSYNNNNAIKVGAEYTPNRGDIRSFMKRVTYRAGVRKGNYYMSYYGQDIEETAVTVGFGIPMKFNSYSMINVGLEYGQRGTTSAGLIKENYVKVSLGLSLFAEDYWFVKPKYD